MRYVLKSLLDCVALFVCGLGAQSAAVQLHWSADIGFCCAALVLSVAGFLRYKDRYAERVSGSVNRFGPGKVGHYALEALKSFVLFLCGASVGDALFSVKPITGLMFFVSAVFIGALVYDRDKPGPLERLS